MLQGLARAKLIGITSAGDGLKVRVAERAEDGSVQRTRTMRHKVVVSGQAADTPARQHDGKFVGTNSKLACSYCTFEFTYKDGHNRGLGYCEAARQELLYPGDGPRFLYADDPCHRLTDR